MHTILQMYVNTNVATTIWPFINVISHFSSFFYNNLHAEM